MTEEFFSSQKCPDWPGHGVHQSLYLVPSLIICDIIPPYPHMPEEQLHFALYIAVMKFQMEISKNRYIPPPRTVVIQQVTKACSQCPAVILLRLCNIFC